MTCFAVQGSSAQQKIQKSSVQRASVAEIVPRRLTCFLLHLPAEEHTRSNQPAVSTVRLEYAEVPGRHTKSRKTLSTHKPRAKEV